MKRVLMLMLVLFASSKAFGAKNMEKVYVKKSFGSHRVESLEIINLIDKAGEMIEEVNVGNVVSAMVEELSGDEVVAAESGDELLVDQENRTSKPILTVPLKVEPLNSAQGNLSLASPAENLAPMKIGQSVWMPPTETSASFSEAVQSDSPQPEIDQPERTDLWYPLKRKPISEILRKIVYSQ